MPNLDSAAVAQIETGEFAPAFFIWIDFLDDPLRASTLDTTVTFAGTGDPDLDGQTFIPFNSKVVDVGDVSNSENGSDTLTVKLSGIPSIDADVMAEIADETKWLGRIVRLWIQVYDGTGSVKHGAISAYYTGYASNISVEPGPVTQTISLEIENYLAASNQASNRSYLNQKDYDPADNSAQATLASANMGRGAPAGGGGGGGSAGQVRGGGGGGHSGGGGTVSL